MTRADTLALELYRNGRSFFERLFSIKTHGLELIAAGFPAQGLEAMSAIAELEKPADASAQAIEVMRNLKNLYMIELLKAGIDARDRDRAACELELLRRARRLH